MKYILLILIFFNLSNKDSKKQTKTNISSNQIEIKIIDSSTLESLTGVRSEETYSDFDGIIKLYNKNSIELDLVSYEKIKIDHIKNDTIIKMNKLK